MHKNKQVSFEKILKKISSCMKTAHQELDQIEKTGMSYERLYETLQEIETFICLLALYIEMEPNLVKDSVSGTAENVKPETIIEPIEYIK
ncbi:hypothetical protein COJ60_29460 [Bacillus cereus]|uniref:hypothetical protein n=1 Tax=Bacillus TaxID=1386 RepID=UPI000BF6B912|nr:MULTISPECIES: hypothetical protein [Bacillus cereus group]MCU5208888.1 hypothetical protein [Bacillus paranthracis]MDA2163798.1 hypothetical protein [Bacillus cereus group sp. Bc252]MDF9513162.1 hypothetical protein [Bacillus paranthracis]MDF9671660.1 hypothetical protein [Bacillus paranthracis]MDG1611940.1 hypothetical protein [Bacillus paranthracis]